MSYFWRVFSPEDALRRQRCFSQMGADVLMIPEPNGIFQYRLKGQVKPLVYTGVRYGVNFLRSRAKIWNKYRSCP